MSSNFVPFNTIGLYIDALMNGTMNIDIPIINLFGNVIVFIPRGIYLPYLFRKLNKLAMFTVIFFVLLLSIEVIQVVTKVGSFDIDDVLLNTVGAWIGFGMLKTKLVQKLLA